jgi:hypothetical protein
MSDFPDARSGAFAGWFMGGFGALVFAGMALVGALDVAQQLLWARQLSWAGPAHAGDRLVAAARVVVRVDPHDPAFLVVDWDETLAAWGREPQPAVEPALAPRHIL